jgi:predicted nucleic acid-binding protein
VTGCVLDTDVVIAALDRADGHHRAAAKALRAMIDDNVPLLLSPINYAETLVRPAEDESALRAAVAAIDALGIQLSAPTPAIARDAAQLWSLNISLADGFALATARAHGASVASFDRRVRRAIKTAGVELARVLR